MRKLNDLQKAMITKNFKVGYLIIKYVEKIGDEKIALENDIELALDIIKERE